MILSCLTSTGTQKPLVVFGGKRRQCFQSNSSPIPLYHAGDDCLVKATKKHITLDHIDIVQCSSPNSWVSLLHIQNCWQQLSEVPEVPRNVEWPHQIPPFEQILRWKLRVCLEMGHPPNLSPLWKIGYRKMKIHLCDFKVVTEFLRHPHTTKTGNVVCFWPILTLFQPRMPWISTWLKVRQQRLVDGKCPILPPHPKQGTPKGSGSESQRDPERPRPHQEPTHQPNPCNAHGDLADPGIPGIPSRHQVVVSTFQRRPRDDFLENPTWLWKPKPLFFMGKLTPDKDWNHDGTATTLEWNGDFMDITMPLKLVCFGNLLE